MVDQQNYNIAVQTSINDVLTNTNICKLTAQLIKTWSLCLSLVLQHQWRQCVAKKASYYQNLICSVFHDQGQLMSEQLEVLDPFYCPFYMDSDTSDVSGQYHFCPVQPLALSFLAFPGEWWDDEIHFSWQTQIQNVESMVCH